MVNLQCTKQQTGRLSPIAAMGESSFYGSYNSNFRAKCFFLSCLLIFVWCVFFLWYSVLMCEFFYALWIWTNFRYFPLLQNENIGKLWNYRHIKIVIIPKLVQIHCSHTFTICNWNTGHSEWNSTNQMKLRKKITKSVFFLFCSTMSKLRITSVLVPHIWNKSAIVVQHFNFVHRF